MGRLSGKQGKKTSVLPQFNFAEILLVQGAFPALRAGNRALRGSACPPWRPAPFFAPGGAKNAYAPLQSLAQPQTGVFSAESVVIFLKY
jgi:hypothetical protein